jgi:GTP-binding protein
MRRETSLKFNFINLVPQNGFRYISALMSEAKNKRTVAIVGRPNVGKSALFNRLVGRRVSIVHEMCGVTRDRVICECTFEEQTFELIDTGGLGNIDSARTQDAIVDGTNKQIDVAIEDADAIIFVVDITSDMAPIDREVARMLHRSGLPVFIAANKSDNTKTELLSAEYESLGFPIYPVSALHNRGVGEMMEDLVKVLPEVEQNATINNPLRVAIIGRPNAGKSSYINRLIRSDRVIVSDVAGTTRDSVEIPFTLGKGPTARHYSLIDTAGVHRQRQSHGAVEKFSLIRTEESIKSADVVVLMLDATEGPKTMDKKIASNVIENKKGLLIIVNKWDLTDGTDVTQTAYTKEIKRTIPFLNFAPLLYTSAHSGLNIKRTIEAIDFVGEQVTTQITTGVLNRVIKDATDRVQPPIVGTRRLKIYYATQVTNNPIRIKLFVNNPKRAPEAYRSYLVNQMRKAFGLEGAPLELIFSNRPRPDKEEKGIN